MTDADRIAHLEEQISSLTKTVTHQAESILLLNRALSRKSDAVALQPVRLTPPEGMKAQHVMTAEEVRAHIISESERVRGKTHVYFIQQGDSGAIKIGCSKKPSQRLQSLQTGHSEPLRLLTCAVGSQAQERALHDRFAHLRVSGEWFRPADDLLSYIRLVADRRAL